MEKIMKRIIWLFIAAPAIYLGIIWNTVPDTIPLHMNLKGEIDRLGDKRELIIAVGILTSINILVYLLLPKVYKIDPKRYAAENKSRLYRIAFSISVFIAGVICLLIYSSARGNIEFGTRFIMAGAGLMIAVVGNYIYTIKPNYFAGIRLPWTLNNDENWKRTHLLAGKLMFIGGLIIAVTCLFTSLVVSIIILITVLLIIMTAIFLYSYRIYKKLDVNR